MSTFQPASWLWEPQRRSIEQVIEKVKKGTDVCLQSPTGSGKTTVAIELMRWAVSMGWPAIFYVNRRRLIKQTADRLTGMGHFCGIRAAMYEHERDDSLWYQVASMQTEHSRVGNGMPPFDAGLVIVDEVHACKGSMLRKCLEDHRSRGAGVVCLSATPVAVKGIVDELIVSGSLAEYRKCRALVPAVVKGVCVPDMSKVKRNPVGEFVIDGKRRRQYVQSIVGNVYGAWKKFNPDARPAMMYAPGVEESVYLTEYFQKRGVPWAHVDSKDIIIEGERRPATMGLWEELQGRFRDGEIKGISNRFVLREGIDIPETYHCILATPVGSIASYLQIVGRVVRYSRQTPDHVLVTDHGGNYLRHGSPNEERPWEEWWAMSHSEVSSQRKKDPTAPEPILCECGTERIRGPKCPDPPYGCGKMSRKAKRLVVMESGELVEMELVKRPPPPPEEQQWTSLFWAFRKGKRGATFKQLLAIYQTKYGKYPPKNLPFMPREDSDWRSDVRTIEFRKLLSKGAANPADRIRPM